MKAKFLVFVISAALILTACATPAGAATSTTDAGPVVTPGVITENYAGALPINSQLALGTIKLKDTPDAITAEQAAVLLPLWQALHTMSTKTAPSQIEINALVGQIQDTMKPNQLQTIAGFKLTQADTVAVLQVLGGANGFGGGRNGTPVARTPGANRGGQGGAPGGGPGGFGGFPGEPGGAGGPGGVGGAGGAATVSPSIQATARAQAGGQRAQIGNTVYFNAVVVYLEQLAPTATATATPTN